MTLDWELKGGLVFGLEADQIMIFDEETEKMQEEPCSIIYVHLGLVSLAIIFD